MNFLNKFTIIIGGRATGKTILAKNIIKSLEKDISTYKIINGTCKEKSEYAEFGTEYENYDDKEMIELIKIQQKKYNGNSDYNKMLIVIDNLAFERTFTKFESVKILFMNHIQYNITVIMTMQYPLIMPPELRSNIEYTFICDKTDYKDQIYNYYAIGFKDKEEFKKALKRNEFLVIDRGMLNPTKYFYAIIANDRIIALNNTH